MAKAKIDSYAPSQENLAATVGGFTFDEFKKMTGAQIGELRSELIAQTRNTSSYAVGKIWPTDEHIFNLFYEWRRFGIPDRSVTVDELQEYMAHYIEFRQAKNPNYGKLNFDKKGPPPSNVQSLTKALFEYFQKNCAYRQPIIREYDLKFFGLHVNIEELVEWGVLEWVCQANEYSFDMFDDVYKEETDQDDNDYMVEDDLYALTGQFLDAWLVRMYERQK